MLINDSLEIPGRVKLEGAVCYNCGDPAGESLLYPGTALHCNSCSEIICDICTYYDMENIPYCLRCFFDPNREHKRE